MSVHFDDICRAGYCCGIFPRSFFSHSCGKREHYGKLDIFFKKDAYPFFRVKPLSIAKCSYSKKAAMPARVITSFILPG